MYLNDESESCKMIQYNIFTWIHNSNLQKEKCSINLSEKIALVL